MTLLAELVATSSRVSGTPSRLAKVGEIATLLGKLSREEVAVGVSYLAGELPQGRIGTEAGNRGASWLKVKRAHTLDLIVLAAEWGHGRRTGKLSNLHLGALDRVTGRYVMLGKTFKGLTDERLAWQTAELLARELRRDQWTVYVRPELVVEIAFSDLQASSRYPGGLALRLARVKRYREDKRPEDADDMEAVRRIYSAQGSPTHTIEGAAALHVKTQ